MSSQNEQPILKCSSCGTTETPKWRNNKTLCNACGLRMGHGVHRGPAEASTSGRASTTSASVYESPDGEHVAHLVQTLVEHNDQIATLEVREKPPRHHRLEQRSTSWLRSVRNPLRGILGFGCASSSVAVDEMEDDERLARVAALALHPDRQERVAPPNALVCVVVGCGSHGRNIAGELLRRGCTVRLWDASANAVEHARIHVRETLEELLSAGLLLRNDVEQLLLRCTAASSLNAAVELGRGHARPLMMIEAVPEVVGVKRLVFSEMAAACIHRRVPPEHVLFCSNTLAIDLLQELAACVPPAYAARVIGLRFLHPCWFVDKVDLMISSPPLPSLSPFIGHSSTSEAHFASDHSSTSQAVANCPVEEGAQVQTAQVVAEIMQALRLQVCPRNRVLTGEEVTLYAVRQRMRVEADNATLQARDPPLSSPVAEGASTDARSPWNLPDECRYTLPSADNMDMEMSMHEQVLEDLQRP